jgi:hypothetical protein
MPDPTKSQSCAEKRRIDEKLDDALEESFPGSDVAAHSPVFDAEIADRIREIGMVRPQGVLLNA